MGSTRSRIIIWAIRLGTKVVSFWDFLKLKCSDILSEVECSKVILRLDGVVSCMRDLWLAYDTAERMLEKCSILDGRVEYIWSLKKQSSVLVCIDLPEIFWTEVSWYFRVH